MKAYEHCVLLLADKNLLTDEIRKDIDTLYDRAKVQLEGVISNNVRYNEPEGSETVAITTFWVFADEAAKDRFVKSELHLNHFAMVKPTIREKFVYDRIIE